MANDEVRKLTQRIANLEAALLHIGYKQMVLEVLVAELVARGQITEADVTEKLRLAQQQLLAEDRPRLRDILHGTFDLAAVTKRRLKDEPPAH